MTTLSRHRVLVCGVLSPLAALFLYALVYGTLTRYSADLDKDWLLRLSLSTLAMTVPFLITLVLAFKDRRRHTFSLSGKIGLAIAILSLGLAWKPVSDGLTRSKQVRNMAMRGVTAPPFDTVDILGKTQRLGDHKGEVVLVNIWATWCGPCREEMPLLSQTGTKFSRNGLQVVGIAIDDADAVKGFIKDSPVRYPILLGGDDDPNASLLFGDTRSVLPYSVLIGRDGKLIAQRAGSFTASELAGWLQPHLGSQP